MVDFDNFRIVLKSDKSPLACYNQLYPYRKGVKELTPDFCQEILSSTANPKVLTELFSLVGEKLEKTPEEYPLYRHLLIGCLLEREAPDKVIQKIKSLQEAHINTADAGAEDYFLGLLCAEKLQQELSPKIAVIADKLSAKDHKKVREFHRLLAVRREQTEALLQAKSQSQKETIKTFSHKYKTDIQLYAKDMDFAAYSGINLQTTPKTKIIALENCTNMPQATNLDECDGVETFTSQDMNWQRNILRLPDSVKDVFFLQSTGFSKEIDLSNLKDLWRVTFVKTDFSGVDHIYFPQESEIGLLNLKNVSHLPDSFDLSAFAKISNLEVDNSYFNKPRLFPDKVSTLVINNFRDANKTELDLSSIAEVKEIRFKSAVLAKIRSFKFPKKVEKIVFSKCYYMPKKLDLNIDGLKDVVFERSGEYAALKELILPKNMEKERHKLSSELPDTKIYFGEKTVPAALKLFHKLKNQLHR